MASKTNLPDSDAPAALAKELADLEAAVAASLPPGAALTIEGLPFDQEAIAGEIDGLLELFELHAEARRRYQRLLESWPSVAREARTFVAEARAALREYLDDRASGPRRRGRLCVGSPAQQYLAALKRDITRERRQTTLEGSLLDDDLP